MWCKGQNDNWLWGVYNLPQIYTSSLLLRNAGSLYNLYYHRGHISSSTILCVYPFNMSSFILIPVPGRFCQYTLQVLSDVGQISICFYKFPMFHSTVAIF